jgi:hypothetical protein
LNFSSITLCISGLLTILTFFKFLRKRKEKTRKNKESKEVPELKPKDINRRISQKKITEGVMNKEEEEKREKKLIRFDEVQKKARKMGVKTIVVEKGEHKENEIRIPPFSKKKDALMIPVKIRDQIEKFILKILYEDKAVKSLKVLLDKVLEKGVEEKIVITEKDISLIIHQMDKDDKIQFTQKEGWKIKI